MKKYYYRYGTIIIVAIIMVFLGFLIVKPFIMPIIGAVIIAYIFYPVYRQLEKKIKRKTLSAILMCFFVFLIVVLPFLFVTNSLIRQIDPAYNWISNAIQNSDYLQEGLLKLYEDFGIDLDINEIFKTVQNQVLQAMQSVLRQVPSKIFNLTISAFFLFFFFRDGPIMFKKATSFFPFSHKETTIILRELKVMADAVIYGQLVTAMVQAALATIAYTLLGVNTPLVWGVLTLFLSLIPMVGPAFVYIPLSASLIISGMAASENGMILRGIALLFIGFGIVSSVDNFIKPLLISDKTRMHPALVLIGVVGGLTQFGFMGIILGPLILVGLFTFFNIFSMKLEIFDHIKERKL